MLSPQTKYDDQTQTNLSGKWQQSKGHWFICNLHSRHHYPRSSSWKLPLFIVSHHIEIHLVCARFILMKMNDAELLLSFVNGIFLYRSFQVQPLAPHMRPIRTRVLADEGKSSASPFIFSTLRRNAKEASKVKRKMWLCKMSVVLIPWDSLAQTSDEPANFLLFFFFFIF